MAIVAPSILSADFCRLGEEIKEVEKAGADWIHIDVMDGHFVPNITIGPPVIASIRKATALPLDVHLMIENSDDFIHEFAKAGSDIITVHQEANIHLDRTIALIKSLGKKAGVSLNPSTGAETLRHVIKDVDLVLIMSVNPGFGGQSFIGYSLEKAREIRKMIAASGSKAKLEIDGGVGPDNCAEIVAAGVDALVAGSAIFKSDNYYEIIKKLKSA
jgi:ribulose-phosphate 3-epimerase